MLHEDFTRQHCMLGRAASFAVFTLLIAYAITLVLGFLSLKSPSDPIGDPYFSILELLIVVIAPLMVIVIIAVHAYASPKTKVYSLTALAFMIIITGISCIVHFVTLTVNRQIKTSGFPWSPLFFSFRWPSLVYAMDIFAWDIFFALSMLFAAPVSKREGWRKLSGFL